MEQTVDRPPAVETAAGDGKSRDKQLSRASSSDSDEMYSTGSPKEILKLGGKAIAPSGEPDIIFIPHVIDKTLILDRNNNNNNNNLTPPSTGDADVGSYRKPTQDEREIYLKNLYELPDFHNFYCPNCNSCLTKVIILRDGPPTPLGPSGKPSQPPPSYPPPRPRSQGPDAGDIIAVNDYDEDGVVCGKCFSFLGPIGAWISSQLGFGQKKTAIQPQPDTAGPSRISHEPKTPGHDSIVVPIPTDDSDERTGQKASGGRSLEIIKSIVYGGLTEAITSLGIVTSAASASTPTENIVALALANLITGLIVITNNLSGLKSNQLKKESNETDEAQVDPYEEALGDRHHYLLHFTTAILSFLLFGLLPPLVYGFSFRDTDDGDLKLAAVAVTSLLCIALLAVGKAYVQKPHKWQEFAKTLVYYITLGFGASGLSYLAGKEFDILLQQLGWFKRDPMPPTLVQLPNMDFAKPTWGSI